MAKGWWLAIDHHVAMVKGWWLAIDHHVAMVKGWWLAIDTFFRRTLSRSFREKRVRLLARVHCSWLLHTSYMAASVGPKAQ